MFFPSRIFRRFIANEGGAAIVEYGIALLVVAGITVGAFTFLASATNTNVGTACTALGSASC